MGKLAIVASLALAISFPLVWNWELVGRLEIVDRVTCTFSLAPVGRETCTSYQSSACG